MANTSDGEERPNNLAGKELLDGIERIERLMVDKQAIADDIKDVKAELKARGYDIAMVNEMIKLRAMDEAKRIEREELRDHYGHSLGIFG